MIHETHLTYKQFIATCVQILNKILKDIWQYEGTVVDLNLLANQEFFASVLLPSIYTVISSSFSPQLQSLLTAMLTLEIMVKKCELNDNEQAFLVERISLTNNLQY